jgi:hypothetical protein
MEISSLTQRVQDLQRAINFWNDWNIVMVAGTALFALGLLITQYIVVQRGKELAAAQDELLRTKDKQLELDLKSKDVGIEEAKERAAVAHTRAEELKHQNLVTEKKLEQERLARIEIEERVASRRIPERERSQLASRLKSFAGQTVSIWFKAGDHEGAIFGADIASALEAAQWNVYAPASIMTFAAAGRRGPTIVETGVVVLSTGHATSIKAADSLVRELTALGFDVRRSPKIEDRPTPTVLVNVEARPEGPQGEAKLRKQKK